MTPVLGTMLAIDVYVIPSVLLSTKYLLSANPLSPGTVHESVICPLADGVAVSTVASGTPPACDVDVADAGPVPNELIAEILYV